MKTTIKTLAKEEKIENSHSTRGKTYGIVVFVRYVHSSGTFEKLVNCSGKCPLIEMFFPNLQIFVNLDSGFENPDIICTDVFTINKTYACALKM